jgi:hypothetical protein
MTDEPNVPRAVVVLELEADLMEVERVLRQRDAGEHPALWAKVAERLWFKVFQMSPEWRDAPPAPGGLAGELAAMTSPRQAAVRIIAQALAAVSSGPDSRTSASTTSGTPAPPGWSCAGRR